MPPLAPPFRPSRRPRSSRLPLSRSSTACRSTSCARKRASAAQSPSPAVLTSARRREKIARGPSDYNAFKGDQANRDRAAALIKEFEGLTDKALAGAADDPSASLPSEDAQDRATHEALIISGDFYVVYSDAYLAGVRRGLPGAQSFAAKPGWFGLIGLPSLHQHDAHAQPPLGRSQSRESRGGRRRRRRRR
jgi:hypothetical protein